MRLVGVLKHELASWPACPEKLCWCIWIALSWFQLSSVACCSLDFETERLCFFPLTRHISLPSIIGTERTTGFPRSLRSVNEVAAKEATKPCVKHLPTAFWTTNTSDGAENTREPQGFGDRDLRLGFRLWFVGGGLSELGPPGASWCILQRKKFLPRFKPFGKRNDDKRRFRGGRKLDTHGKLITAHGAAGRGFT